MCLFCCSTWSRVVFPNRVDSGPHLQGRCHVVRVLEVWPPYISSVSTQLSQSFSAYQPPRQCPQLIVNKPIVQLGVVNDKQRLRQWTTRVMLTIVTISTNHSDTYPGRIRLDVHNHRLSPHHPSQVIHNSLFRTVIPTSGCRFNVPAVRHPSCLNASRFQVLSRVAQFTCDALPENPSQLT